MTFKTKEPIPTYMIYLAILGESYARNTSGKYSIYSTQEFINRVSYSLSDLERLAEEMKLFSAPDLRVADLVLPIRTGNENLFTLSYL